MRKIKNNKAFTLAELLIVVAIIAVLVAIAIPVFTSQLEKSREGVDAANIRSAYAEVLAARMGSSGEYYKALDNIKQEKAGWITDNDWPDNLDMGSYNTGTAGPVTGTEYAVVSDGEGSAKFVLKSAVGTATDVDTLG